RREAVAHRLVSMGLVAVGVASVAAGSGRLITGDRADGSTAGAVLAAFSVFALGALAGRKRGLARRLRDRALTGDAYLSAIGAVRASLALLGSVRARHPGAAWP